MKKLLANGLTLIASQPKPKRVRYSDPWPSHAVEFVYRNYVKPPFNDYWIVYDVFKLKDGKYYAYTEYKFDSEAGAIQAMQAPSGYRNPDGIVGAFGEWWNYVGRGQVTGKSLSSY